VVPIAFLGLSRPDPRLVLAELDADEVVSPSHTLRFVVDAPPCIASRCWVEVASRSPSGAGSASRAYGPGETAIAFQFEHGWRVEPGDDAEPADLHVLAGDEGATQFAYLRTGGIMVSPGHESDLATLTPIAVEPTAPVTIAAAGAAVPVGWDYSVTVRLELPGGVSIPMRYAASAALVTRFPLIESAAFVASAAAQAPRADDRPLFQSSVSAWSGRVGLLATQAVLDLPPPVDVLRPKERGTVSRRGRGIAWSPDATGVATIDLRDLGRGRRDFRVTIAGGALSFARLDRLGLALPEPGAHLLDITATPGTLDALTGPSAGASGAGASSHTRIEITVGP
jgi:hypothetical protein